MQPSLGNPKWYQVSAYRKFRQIFLEATESYWILIYNSVKTRGQENLNCLRSMESYQRLCPVTDSIGKSGVYSQPINDIISPTYPIFGQSKMEILKRFPRVPKLCMWSYVGLWLLLKHFCFQSKPFWTFVSKFQHCRVSPSIVIVLFSDICMVFSSNKIFKTKTVTKDKGEGWFSSHIWDF